MDFYSSMRDFALFSTPLLWKKRVFWGWGKGEKNDEGINIPCPLQSPRWLQHSPLPHGIVDLIYIYEHFWDNQSIIILIYISAYSHIRIINSLSICLKEMIHCMNWNSGSIKQQPSFWELIIQRLQFGIILLLRCYSCNPNEFCLSSYVYAMALVSLLITNASWGKMPNFEKHCLFK